MGRLINNFNLNSTIAERNGSDEPVEKRGQWVRNDGDGRLRLGPDPLQTHRGSLMNIPLYNQIVNTTCEASHVIGKM